MKTFVFSIMAILPYLLFCVTRTVAIDASQQYTSIQSAVNDSRHGDVVQVYPGRYEENIEFIDYNISLVSLYSTNAQQQYIENTIIDGNLSSCIRVVNGETVMINGLTLVNNEDGNYISPNFAGGGIYVRDYSHAIVSNCIIRNCFALAGGGISITDNASLTMSNVKIYDNIAIQTGGGLSFKLANNLSIDTVHPSSIYNNYASQGMDFSIYFITYDPTPYYLNLDLGSIAMTVADGYFVNSNCANLSVNIAQSFISQIDNDMYVAPDGDDTNSGLSAEAPLKTIAYAMQRIAVNSDNPRTLNLAAGVYSHSINAQLFPFAIKSHVRILGAGTEATILDGEYNRTFWSACHANNVEISGMKMINARSEYTIPTSFFYSNDIKVHDLVFMNNIGSMFTGLTITYCFGVIIDSVVAGFTASADNDLITFNALECNNVFINNIISAGNSTSYNESNYIGVSLHDSDVVLRNSIVANNDAIDAWIFIYQNNLSSFADYNLDMSNMLFTNNTITHTSWVNAPIYMQNRYQQIQMNNCTVANNSTNNGITTIYAGADIRNLISYNPGAGTELYLLNYLSSTGLSYDVSVSNSLFSSSNISCNYPARLTLSDNIMSANPVFLGSVQPGLNVTQSEYYQLSAQSPCINTGIADTTGLNLPPMDLAGNWRIWDGRIDMGCYEYGSEPVDVNDPELPTPPAGILMTVYPNPLLNTSQAGGVFIEFSMVKKPVSQPVIEIFNIRGQKVKTTQLSESYNSLVNKAGLSGDVKQNGELYSTIWNGKDDNNRPLASGTYIVRVMADKMVATKKITIIK